MESGTISEKREEILEKKPVVNRRALFFCAAVFTLGALLSARLSLPAALYFALSGLFLLGGALLRRRAFSRLLLLVCIFFLGMGGTVLSLSPAYPDLDLTATYALEGRVVRKTVKESYALYKLSNVRIEGAEIEGSVFLTSSCTAYETDDILLSKATLYLPETAAYDGGFDDFLYCRSQNVLFRARSVSDGVQGRAEDLWAQINTLRKTIGEKIETVFTGQAALAKALVTGDEEDILEDTKELFNLSGLTHILSISGSHIVMMAAVFSWILKRCKAGRRLSFVLKQVFLLFYAAFTGFRVSILRAALMYEADMTGRFFGQKRDPLTFLSAAYLAVVLPAPAQIFDLGLQLSFGAVFSILCLAPVFSRFFRIKNKSVDAVLSSGLAANIGLFPIVVNTNNTVWAPGLLLNTAATLYSLFLIPAMSVLTAVSLSLGGQIPFLGAAGDFLIDCLVWMARIPQFFPGLYFYLRDIPALLSVIWFAVIFLCSDKTFFSKKAKRVFAAFTAVVTVLWLNFPIYRGKTVRLEFLDCSGTCAILYTEEGGEVLLGSSANSDLTNYVLNKGIDFDASFVIIKDKDSMEGMEALSSIGRAGEVYASKEIARVLKNKYGISATVMQGANVRLSERCTLTFIYRKTDDTKTYPVGMCLQVDGQNSCLFLSEYVEALPEGLEGCAILDYSEALRTDIFSRISCSYAVVRMEEWGAALRYGAQDLPYRLLNTYETGKLSARIGEKVTMEGMYACGCVFD